MILDVAVAAGSLAVTTPAVPGVTDADAVLTATVECAQRDTLYVVSVMIAAISLVYVRAGMTVPPVFRSEKSRRQRPVAALSAPLSPMFACSVCWTVGHQRCVCSLNTATG